MVFKGRTFVTHPPTKILIVLIAGIGDLVLASKSIRAIHNGHPKAEIHLLTSTDAAPLARKYPYVDCVVPFPIREWKSGDIRLLGIVDEMRRLRGRGYDLVVNLYASQSVAGAIRMGCLLMLSGARERVGIDGNGLGGFLTKKLPATLLTGRHVADMMLEVARLAGAVADDGGIEVFWGSEAEERSRQVLAFRTDGSGPVVGINPGGNRRNRRWNPGSFAAVADGLVERERAAVVLLGGPGEEAVAETIQRCMRHDVINLAGRLDLEELACLISRLDVLVTNDSAPMHIAAAVRTPQVALFGPEDPLAFHPYTRPELYEITCADIACRPCRQEECGNPRCLDLITPDAVLEKCQRLLKGRFGGVTLRYPSNSNANRGESRA